MQTQLVLNIDNQTVDLVNLYAKEKGLSVSEMIEFCLKLRIFKYFKKTPQY